MKDDAVIVLDPVNRDVIDRALDAGVKNFIGGNCTVSLMLMAMAGLFRAGLVEWVSAMTYQAASGAGAQNMRELVAQMGVAARVRSPRCSPTRPRRSSTSIATVTDTMRGARLPDASSSATRSPAACCPGSTRTSATARARKSGRRMAEGNKILGRETHPIPIDGLCVRIGAMRCHSQALTVKLTRDVPLPRSSRCSPARTNGPRSCRTRRKPRCAS